MLNILKFWHYWHFIVSYVMNILQKVWEGSIRGYSISASYVLSCDITNLNISDYFFAVDYHTLAGLYQTGHHQTPAVWRSRHHVMLQTHA